MTVPLPLYEKALSQVRELKKLEPDLAPVLGCYEAILQAQRDVRAGFGPDLRGLDVDRCRGRNAAGSAFLQARDIRVPWGLFDELFARIGAVSVEHADLAEADGPPSLSGRDAAWHRNLLRGLLVDRAVVERCAEEAGGIAGALFTFLACHSATPFLEAYADAVREHVDISVWSGGDCPVCGGHPLMGRLDKETGKKRLQCHLCRTEWGFGRLRCPFCDNRDQTKLHFFSEEGDAAHRVDLCDVCRRYLKTVDGRRSDRNLELVVENVATMHLDLVAQREGYGDATPAPRA